jgi:uncharacterized protein YccT (UPF0319 family)
MKCKNCLIELEISKGDKPRVFCSDKCRKAFNRNITEPEKQTDKTKQEANGQKQTDKIETSLKDLTAEDLYFKIDCYPNDSWKDSIEYNELIKRLNNKDISVLSKEGYIIPNWKRGKEIRG